MLNYYTDPIVMPTITVYMNCDTRLAINLDMFNISEEDEFVFVIKNYNYIDSPYAFLYRARKNDIDENGEIIFKITPEDSKKIKPGAFYNFAILLNAFNRRAETEYKKLTPNGKIKIEFGAHDLALPQEEVPLAGENYRVVSARLEDPNTTIDYLTSADSLVRAQLVKVKEES